MVGKLQRMFRSLTAATQKLGVDHTRSSQPILQACGLPKFQQRAVHLPGTGFTTFSVGDGVTFFLPYYNATTASSSSVFLLPGEKINVSAAVTFPNGQCCVSGGSFNATFTLNTPTGKIEGQVPLAYNGTSQLWQGSFPIPYSADQGAWVLTISGTDSSGNSGSAYSWLNVGLNVLLITDSPSYIIGDSVTIFAAPVYPNGLVTASGNFTAAVTFDSKLISEVPMSFNWLIGLWAGTFTLRNNRSLRFLHNYRQRE